MNNATASRRPATQSRQAPHARHPPKRPRIATTSRHGKVDDPRKEFSDEECKDMVATAAYYKAERRGFGGSSPADFETKGE